MAKNSISCSFGGKGLITLAHGTKAHSSGAFANRALILLHRHVIEASWIEKQLHGFSP